MMNYYASCPFFSCYMFCNLYVNSVTTLKLNDFCEHIQCIVFVKLIFMTGHLTSLFQVIIYSNSFTGIRGFLMYRTIWTEHMKWKFQLHDKIQHINSSANMLNTSEPLRTGCPIFDSLILTLILTNQFKPASYQTTRVQLRI